MSLPGKRRREISINPTLSSSTRPSTPKRNITTDPDDFTNEFDIDIKIETRPESPLFILPHDPLSNDPLSINDTPTGNVSVEGSKRRKQSFTSAMYTNPIFIPSSIQPDNTTTTTTTSSTPIRISNVSKKSTTTLTTPKPPQKPSYKELEQLLVKSQNELTTLKLEKETLEKRVHEKDNSDLQQSVKVLTQTLSNTKKELEDASQKISVLEREKCNLLFVIKDFQNSKSYKEKIEVKLKEKTALEISLKKQLEHLKLHACETLCKKFDLNAVQTWDSYLLYSYFGFYEYSSIQSLINMLSEYQIKSQGITPRPTKLSLGHQVLMCLLKIRLDVPSRALMHFFGISKSHYYHIYNGFIDTIYKLFYEGDSRIIKIPSKETRSFSSNILSSSCSSSTFSTTITNSLSNCSEDVSNNHHQFVIDFVEFEMESRQCSTNSTNTETFVVNTLIACTLEGNLVFVSDLYDEELESNKSIIIKSKFLDQLEEGDVLISETDFGIQDILPNGVSICIPSPEISMATKNIFTEAKQVIRDVVLKIRPLKILNILQNKEPDKFVKVCLGLTTFIQKKMGQITT